MYASRPRTPVITNCPIIRLDLWKLIENGCTSVKNCIFRSRVSSHHDYNSISEIKCIVPELRPINTQRSISQTYIRGAKWLVRLSGIYQPVSFVCDNSSIYQAMFILMQYFEALWSVYQDDQAGSYNIHDVKLLAVIHEIFLRMQPYLMCIMSFDFSLWYASQISKNW